MQFSIIIPIFNAEKYLIESINSVINQTLDFKKNTELILVDDGSTDKSREICTEYAQKYPTNIKYIYRKNSGPANARNAGLNAISAMTKYVGFLDADDYFSTNTLENVKNFFETYSRIQLAVIPLYHFDRIDTSHRLNYRFKDGNRIINILEEYKGIHFHVGGCFIRSKQICGEEKLRFRSDLRFWEDALLINTFLLRHKEYGVVAAPKYYYRKRMEEDSLVNNAWYQKSRYSEMINSCYLFLIQESKRLYNRVIPYIQFLIIYHMRLYLFPKNNYIIYDVLNKREQDEFFLNFSELINIFESKYILEQDMPYYYKNYLLNLKKHGWPFKSMEGDCSKGNIIITSIKLKGLSLIIKGQYSSKEYIMKAEDQLFLKKGKRIIPLPKEETPAKLRTIWGTVVRDYTHSGFKASIPLYYVNLKFGIRTNTGKYILNKRNLVLILIKRTISFFIKRSTK